MGWVRNELVIQISHPKNIILILGSQKGRLVSFLLEMQYYAFTAIAAVRCLASRVCGGLLGATIPAAVLS